MSLIYTEDSPSEIVERAVHSCSYNKQISIFESSFNFFFFFTFNIFKTLINYENNSTFLCGISQIPKALGIERLDQFTQ